MMWSLPGIPAAWGYALMTAGMILFWILAIFGAIVLVHHLGRDDRPTLRRTVAFGVARRLIGAVGAGITRRRTDRPAEAPSTY